jgi:hypothetical protein
MQRLFPHDPCRRRGWQWLGLIAVLPQLTGCHAQQPPAYQNAQGFRFTPPPGWVERARDDALSGKTAHRPPDLPLPRLGLPGSAAPERLLVRYDRLTAGHLAWLRITVTDLPSATPLPVCVAARAPGPTWKRESDVESLEVSGWAAARIAFTGRWSDQEYVSETVAVRQGEQVYFITASFPVADSTAREQVRQAVAGATWP